MITPIKATPLKIQNALRLIMATMPRGMKIELSTANDLVEVNGVLLRTQEAAPFICRSQNIQNISNYIGDCRSEELIDSLFGSVTDFARLCEERGNTFTIPSSLGTVEVKYCEVDDIHTFFRKY